MENEVNATVESAEEKTAEPAKVKKHLKIFSSPKFAKVKDILKKIRKWLLLAVAAICILVPQVIANNVKLLLHGPFCNRKHQVIPADSVPQTVILHILLNHKGNCEEYALVSFGFL